MTGQDWTDVAIMRQAIASLAKEVTRLCGDEGDLNYFGSNLEDIETCLDRMVRALELAHYVYTKECHLTPLEEESEESEEEEERPVKVDPFH
jgi:hypothetical protein